MESSERGLRLKVEFEGFLIVMTDKEERDRRAEDREVRW